MYLSAAAYCAQSLLMPWGCQACKNVPDTKFIAYLHDSGTDATGYVAVVNGRATIVFRGTSNLADWIQDLKFAHSTPLEGCSGCEVELGFNENYNALQSQILTALSGIDTSAGLAITGHSLGAAMAALAAWDLSHSYNVVELYTFGEPRVGNAAFAAALAASVTAWRVTHNADIVPHVPFEDLGYQHHPTEIWYNEASSGFTQCSSSNGWVRWTLHRCCCC